MAVLSDILALLDKWPLWKRMTEAPGRIDELERRIAALEATPKRAPGRECKACGALAMRMQSSRPDPVFGDLGGTREDWKCEACGSELRDVAANP